MEVQKRTPFWKRCLIVLFLLFASIGPFYLMLALNIHFVIRYTKKLTPLDSTPWPIILLLLLFTALLVWMIIWIIQKKHRITACFFVFLALCSIIKTIPHLDNQEHKAVPELVATFPIEDRRGIGNPDFYYDSCFVGDSMRKQAQNSLPEDVQTELNELFSDRRFTWIVTAEYQLTEVSWSPEECTQHMLWPWQTGLVYAGDEVLVPGETNVLYVYRIPFAPIDNIF